MKLECFRAIPGNFGDDLNAWLWPQLFPGLLENDDERHLIGIGSILDTRYARLPGTKVVFGSGARSVATAPKLDESWDVRFVRGPLTAAALGLKPATAITDGAAAILNLGYQRIAASSGVGFMPHYRSLGVVDWETLCESARVRFIDPTKPVPHVLEAIGAVDRLITEALHGAIVADSLRVPWLRVCCHSIYFEGAEVSEFKWRDWGGSLGLEIAAQPFVSIGLRARSAWKRAATFPWRTMRRAALVPALARLAHSTHFQLSAKADLARATARIEAEVHRLRVELRPRASVC